LTLAPRLGERTVLDLGHQAVEIIEAEGAQDPQEGDDRPRPPFLEPLQRRLADAGPASERLLTFVPIQPQRA
jgi:hypothetical protein